MEIMTVLDMVAQRYLEPFFTPTIDAAIRSFRAAVNTPEHQFAKFPEDYVLYHIGRWDEETGEVEGVEGRKIAMASQFSMPFGNQLELKEGTNDAA